MVLTLPLTHAERALFDMLKAVLAQSGCGSVVRVAGGWVRDKVPPPCTSQLAGASHRRMPHVSAGAGNLCTGRRHH